MLLGLKRKLNVCKKKQKMRHEKRLENEIAETQARKEAYRKKVEADLPPEPPLGQGDGITKLKFRLPKGNILREDSMPLLHLSMKQVLLDFLVVKGYPTEEYKVISSWPRRDVSINIASIVAYCYSLL
ncbi:hypothetical protein NQ317_002992 [Molorchus minor]|uniref:UBX domain-containing protein n=1 Tax=Molorchus minor TaxID=1323400 RepID=A0ABQ9JL50_9CUCU|nr:hypothetical protein NQ317_002992 [Molorchus minor]